LAVNRTAVTALAAGVLTAGVLTAGALAGLVVGLSVASRWRIATVDGPSMAPTLDDGDRVLVRRIRPAALRRGDLAMVTQPGVGSAPGWIIKRVAALPGDALPGALVPALGGPGDRVPPRMLVLLGDNPHASVDSRDFGYVPDSRLFGVVVRRM